MSTIRAVVTDIEGTTTPITFVKDVLFPFAAKNVEAFLAKNWSEESVRQDVDDLIEEALRDTEYLQAKEGSDKGEPESSKIAELKTVHERKLKGEKGSKIVANYVRWLIQTDRKVKPLKSLQGKIWREGYENGELKGDLFDDVAGNLRKWCKMPPVSLEKEEAVQDGAAETLRLYVYSSGSIPAQKLLFGYSKEGSLLSCFSGYFDLTTGNKREKESYEKIATNLEVEPASILFLTDIYEEAVAAAEAG